MVADCPCYTVFIFTVRAAWGRRARRDSRVQSDPQRNKIFGSIFSKKQLSEWKWRSREYCVRKSKLVFFMLIVRCCPQDIVQRIFRQSIFIWGAIFVNEPKLIHVSSFRQRLGFLNFLSNLWMYSNTIPQCVILLYYAHCAIGWDLDSQQTKPLPTIPKNICFSFP